MIDQLYTLGMLVKVIFGFIVLYMLIPSRIISFEEEADSFFDKLFVGLTHSVFVTIILVHSLVFLRLYDVFSLLFGYFCVCLIVLRQRGKSWSAIADALGMRLVINLLDLSESKVGLLGETAAAIKKWFNKKRRNTVDWIWRVLKEPFSGILPLIVFLCAVYLRFKYSINHGALVASDSYEHLVWSKYLGFNQIYHDGIYPHGYHTVISALSKIFFIDPYWIVRFIGPIFGVLIVLSVYYVAVKITRDQLGAFITLFLFAFINNSKFPAVFSRQTTALPMEFAYVFALTGFYFLWLYFKTEKKSFILLYAESLTITVMVHPFAAVYLVIWSAVMLIISLLILKLNVRHIGRYISYSFLFGLVGLLPLGIGKLTGNDFFVASEFIQENISYNLPTIDMLIKLFAATGNIFFDIGVYIVLIILVTFIFIKVKERTVLFTTIIACTFIMLLLYRASDLNLPQITHPARTGVFLAPMIGILYASGFESIGKIISYTAKSLHKNYVNITLCCGCFAICVSLLFNYPPGKLNVRPLEYEAAVANYLVIKRDFPALDWTIIGPAEQLQEAVGYGWHTDLLRFVQAHTPEEVGKREFVLPIPTHHIFVYTEKVPLHWEKALTENDADLDLEPEGPDPFKQYYMNGRQRSILEAKAIQLMEAYKDAHSNITIFYEDDNMRIYHINHKPPKMNG